MTALTEIPGIINRIDKLEEYVYVTTDPEDHVVKKVKPDEVLKEKDITLPEDMKKTHEDENGVKSDKKKQFQAATHIVELTQDLEKRGHSPKLTMHLPKKDDDELHKVPYQKISDKPTVTDKKIVEVGVDLIEKHPEEIIETTEGFPQQLKEQVVLVESQLWAFQVHLQKLEDLINSLNVRISNLENSTENVGQRISNILTSYSKKTEDFYVVKNMVDNHQISIKNIKQQIERKAEAYAVNQKVGKTELTVIEDRMLKLCDITSTEITNLEEKLDSSLQKFKFELSEKLPIMDLEVRLEVVFHKLKLLENRLKDMRKEFLSSPVLDTKDIRNKPVEIKRFVINKDGSKVSQSRRNVTPNTKATHDSIQSILTQHHADIGGSSGRYIQIHKEVEIPTNKERYISVPYSNIKAERR